MAKVRSRGRLKARLAFLYIASFLVTTLPLIFVLAANWEKYVRTPADAVKLSFGGVIVLALLVVKVIGKAGVPRRITVEAVALVLVYLFEAVILDLKFILLATLIGEAIDYIIFQRAIRATKEKLLIDKTADATVDKVEELLQKYTGGRV